MVLRICFKLSKGRKKRGRKKGREGERDKEWFEKECVTKSKY